MIFVFIVSFLAVAHALNDEAAAAAAVAAVATSPAAAVVTESILNKTKEITAKSKKKNNFRSTKRKSFSSILSALVRQIRENIVVVANQSNVTRPI